jgi:chromosome segregation ATPase
MSQAEIDRLTAQADRLSRTVTERLQPEIDRLTARAAELTAKVPPIDSAEMADLERQIAAITERMQPSPDAISRLSADAVRLSDRDLSKAERERLEKEVHQLSESLRPSAEDRANLRRLVERQRGMTRGLDRAQLQSLEASRRELEAEARALHESIERELGPMLRELREEKGALKERAHEPRAHRPPPPPPHARPEPPPPPPEPPPAPEPPGI